MPNARLANSIASLKVASAYPIGNISLIFNTFTAMDDLQFWLYVILGIVYLISQVRKKSKQQQNLPPEKPLSTKPASQTPQWKTETQNQNPTTSPKTLTFEELLREITEAKTPKSTPEYETYKQPEYVDYDDNIGEEIQDLEDVDYDYRKTDSIYSKYDEAKAKDYSNYSLEESQKLEAVDMKFGKFKEFETETRENLLDLYTRDLKGLEGMKRAVVLNEVLNPKYF